MVKTLFIALFCLIGIASTAIAADCAAVGQRVATEQAGQLAQSLAQTKNGRPICVVVVIIPSSDGGKPRRVEVAVPAD